MNNMCTNEDFKKHNCTLTHYAHIIRVYELGLHLKTAVTNYLICV